MENIVIKYNFKLPDDTKEEYILNIDGNSLELILDDIETKPDWARLEYCQCSNCTLDVKDHPYCPIMIKLVGIVRGFDRILSHEKVVLKVVTEERYVAQKTSAQRALSSLMGLVIAASGCPHTVFFKPMARFHLPLANSEETLYRAASTYLLAQYFKTKKGNLDDNGNSYDLTGLGYIYKAMQIINVSLADRLRTASVADSSVNALVLLDMFAKVVPFFIDESLEKLEYLFSQYIDDSN